MTSSVLGRATPRPWTLLVVAVCLAVLLSSVWVVVRLSGEGGRIGRVVPPGETVQLGGATVRLTDAYTTGRLIATNGPEYDAIAPAGSTYLVVLVEVDATQVQGDTFYCAARALGADGRRWDVQFDYVLRDSDTNCPPLGQSGSVELRFVVPDAQMDRLSGLLFATNETSDDIPPLLLFPRPTG